MLAGELYNALDPGLSAERRRARNLTKELNDSHDEDQEQRADIIRRLFASIGKGIWIEPPFYCDYGSNITLGDYVFFNFNCVILDPAQVVIGSSVLFGPNVQIYTASHPIAYLERVRVVRHIRRCLSRASELGEREVPLLRMLPTSTGY